MERKADPRNTFENPKFSKRIKSMLKLDFYRLFRSPIFYIMIGIAAAIPALILGTSGIADPATGEISTAFNNVWQMIDKHSGSTAGFMDFAKIWRISICFSSLPPY